MAITGDDAGSGRHAQPRNASGTDGRFASLPRARDAVRFTARGRSRDAASEGEPLASVLGNCRRLLEAVRAVRIPVFHVHSHDPDTGGQAYAGPVLPGLAADDVIRELTPGSVSRV